MSKKEGGRMEQAIDMNNHHIENLKAPTANDHGVNKGYVDTLTSGLQIPPAVDTTQFLKLDGTTPLKADLDMGGHQIPNLGTPQTHDNDHAVNVGFFNQELNASNANLVKTMTSQFKKYVDDSQVAPSGSQKDVFRYLMQDANQSSSESNIIVQGIVDYGNSPHSINQKAYKVKLIKDTDGSNDYRSRIGFNLYQLAFGPFTMTLEYFPPEIINVSVTADGTTIYIASQNMKSFGSYTKTIVQFNNTSKESLDYIYFDLHGVITKANDVGYIIVYGIEGYHSSVDPAVYDNWYNGNLEMNTDIDMGGNSIKNLKSPVSNKDTVNKEYTEANYLSKNGGEMKSELSMGAKRITNLASPRFDYEATNAKYVEDNYVQLSGASGDLSMNNHKITNLGLPKDSFDGVCKQYLNNIVSHGYLYGSTNSVGFFVMNSSFTLEIERAYIVSVKIRTKSSYINAKDMLLIRQSGLHPDQSFNFNHSPNVDTIVNIGIMQYYIYSFRLLKSINLPFSIQYLTLNI